jgi:hypothetical protein
MTYTRQFRNLCGREEGWDEKRRQMWKKEGCRAVRGSRGWNTYENDLNLRD